MREPGKSYSRKIPAPFCCVISLRSLETVRSYASIPSVIRRINLNHHCRQQGLHQDEGHVCGEAESRVIPTLALLLVYIWMCFS